MATWQNKEDLHCYGEGIAIGDERNAGLANQEGEHR